MRKIRVALFGHYYIGATVEVEDDFNIDSDHDREHLRQRVREDYDAELTETEDMIEELEC